MACRSWVWQIVCGQTRLFTWCFISNIRCLDMIGKLAGESAYCCHCTVRQLLSTESTEPYSYLSIYSVEPKIFHTPLIRCYSCRDALLTMICSLVSSIYVENNITGSIDEGEGRAVGQADECHLLDHRANCFIFSHFTSWNLRYKIDFLIFVLNTTFLKSNILGRWSWSPDYYNEIKHTAADWPVWASISLHFAAITWTRLINVTISLVQYQYTTATKIQKGHMTLSNMT